MRDLNFERKHAEDLQRLRGLRLLDDDFMNKVFEDTTCAEFLLQILLQRTDLRVRCVHSQHDIKNLQGRSVRLDILAVDEANRVYNIEVQRSDKGAGVKRARYNSSLIDANVTEPGDEYEKLNETYVIFITEHDVLGGGQPIYHVDRTIKETGALFGDESHILYVNAQIKDDTTLGQLMHDFSCTSAEQMHYQILANRVRYFKEDQEGVATMCKAMEDMRNEAVKENAINEMHIYELPWPKEELLSLGDMPITMRITLSYFIEPGPGAIGWKDRYRYPSCLLRFDLKNKNEDVEDFKKRINRAARDDEKDSGDGSSGSERWYLGKKNRDVGSIHSDIWTGTAADLSQCNHIGIFPAIGWWKERKYLNCYQKKIRYSLVVSLESPDTEIDLYTPIKIQITPPVVPPIAHPASRA